MPVFFQQTINENSRIAVWKIDEPENFFLNKVSVQRDITHLNKRLQHLAGRYLLQYLYPDFPNEDILVAATRKPFLKNEQYHFSISHCGHYAAALVSAIQRVGVDIEYVTARLFKICHKFLNDEELIFINSQPENVRLTLLSILWSAKEAMYKWYGAGEVDFKEMMRTTPFKCNHEGQLSARFIHPAWDKELILHYRCIHGLTLVWVVSDNFGIVT